jgi:hypothetical protein
MLSTSLPSDLALALLRTLAAWRPEDSGGSMTMSGKPDLPAVVDTPARLVTVSKQSGAPDVRMFDVTAINASIDKAMATLKPGERVAAIAYVDKTGANIAIVGKLKAPVGQASWTVIGTKEWSGDWNASAALRWSI